MSRKKIVFLLIGLIVTITSSQLQAQIIEGSGFICLNGSTELTANDNYAMSYDWSTGEQTQSIVVDIPGWYYLNMVDANGMLLMDSIFLSLSALPDNSIFLIGPQNICLGSMTSIEVSQGFLYQWSNGSDQSSIQPTSSGNYFCIITDPYSGCTSTTDTVSIGVYEFLGIEEDSDGLNCTGDIVTLTAPLADTYYWSTGESSQSIQVTGSGNYTVNVNNGVCDVDLSQNVIFNASPNLDLGPDLNLCDGGAFTLCGPPGMQTYQWCNGETTECIEVIAENAVHCLEVVSFTGCEAADSVTITLGQSAPPEISITGGNENACEGDTLILQSSFPVINWNTGALTQSIEVSTSGTYWVLSNDLNGCQADTGFIEITFHSLPEAIIYSDDDLVQCPSENFSIELSTDEYASYFWNVFAVTQDITVDEVGEYYVIVSDEFGCTDTSELVTVGLFSVPILGAIAGEDNPSANSIEDYILTDFTGANYFWNVEGGSIIGDSTSNEVSVQWSDYSNAEICGWIETEDACLSDTSCLLINFSTSIDAWDSANSDIQIWPNPVSDKIYWSSKSEMSESYIIDTNSRKFEIEELELLTTGRYFLVLRDSQSNFHFKSFIKH